MRFLVTEVDTLIRKNHERLGENFACVFGFELAQIPYDVYLIRSFVGRCWSEGETLIRCPNVLGWILLDDSIQVSVFYDLLIDHDGEFLSFDVTNVRVLDCPELMPVRL